MAKLSISQIISVWIITLNSLAINAVLLFKKINNSTISNNHIESQMEKILKKDILRVAIYKNKAYWVLNNVIYKAEIDEYGNILDDMAEEVDVFKLSEKEVNNLLNILDSINN